MVVTFSLDDDFDGVGLTEPENQTRQSDPILAQYTNDLEEDKEDDTTNQPQAPGLHLLGRAAASTTPNNQQTHSILGDRLRSQNPILDDPAMIRLELEWQRHTGVTEELQAAFRDDILLGSDICGFAFMSPESPFKQTCYNICRYAQLHPTTMHLRSNVILFCGDRKTWEEPHALMFANEDWWKWKQVTCNNGYVAFTTKF